MQVDLGDAARIASWELRRLLRDGHTLVYSIALPLFLYPTLFLGAVQVVTIARGAAERRVARVAIVEEGRVPEVTARLKAEPKVQIVPLPAGPLAIAAEGGRWIREGGIDAVVSPYRDESGRLVVEVHYSAARDASSAALARVESALEGLPLEELRRRAAEIGEGPEFLETFTVRGLALLAGEERARDGLARAIPLLLLFMLAIGAFYPALDSTVGERERGALETTLLAPVRRTAIVLGKFLTVTGLALLAAALNFASMAAALWFFLLQADRGLRLAPLSPSSLLVLLLAAVLMALLLSAVMLAISLFARSFKEGQSYLGPVLLLVTVPGIAATVPEIHLNAFTALAPVLNLSLLVRDAIQEKHAWGPAALALSAAALYTALAIAIGGALARSETVLLGSPAARPRRRALAALLGRA